MAENLVKSNPVVQEAAFQEISSNIASATAQLLKNTGLWKRPKRNS
jgi:hypothetical protein